MDSGYYAAMTGLVARTEALDTAAGTWPMLRLPATGRSGSTFAPFCWGRMPRTRNWVGR